MQRPLFCRFLFVIGLLVCGYFLFCPTPPLPQGFAHSDKLGYVGGFFVLMLLGYRATSCRFGVQFLILLAGLLALAVGSEWIQSAWLPLRTASRADLAANLCGCVLGLAVVAGLQRRRGLHLIKMPKLG